MNLTQKQRHEIYKKAYNDFTSRKDCTACLCYYLQRLHPDYYSKDLMKDFEEFNLFRPKHLTHDDVWFPQDKGLNGYKTRVAVLLLCIEMTKP